MVVADPGMSEMNGIGFIRPLRQPPPDRGAPLAVLAAESDNGLKPQAKLAGTAGHLAKPFKPELFIAANKKAPG